MVSVFVVIVFVSLTFLEASAATSPTNPSSHTFLSSTPLHTTPYRALYEETYSSPSASYTVLTSPSGGTTRAVTCLIWNTALREFSLVTELYPSARSSCLGTAAGLVDPGEAPPDAAVREAGEECGLGGDVRCYQSGEARVMDKYVRSDITPFLVVHSAPKRACPGGRDVEEEGMDVVYLTYEELMKRKGGMSVVGEWAVDQGLDLWREMGLGEGVNED